jgi:hypothetical protein
VEHFVHHKINMLHEDESKEKDVLKEKKYVKMKEINKL